jgi:hypothetical protein
MFTTAIIATNIIWCYLHLVWNTSSLLLYEDLKESLLTEDAMKHNNKP